MPQTLQEKKFQKDTLEFLLTGNVDALEHPTLSTMNTQQLILVLQRNRTNKTDVYIERNLL